MNDQPTGIMIGRVDNVDKDRVSGWAYDPSRPDERVVVEVLQGEQPICTIEADIYREDLLRAGMGDGRHGFAFTLPMDLFTAPLVVLRLRAMRIAVDLVNSPVRIRNHRAMVNDETLETLSEAVRSAAITATTTEELQTLSSWLIEHFDIVHQRQTRLAISLREERSRFLNLISGNSKLSDVLRQAAAAITAQYEALSLPDVDKPKVTVIIPVFGNFDYTHRCLTSIINHLPAASLEVLIIDDESVDQTIYASLVLSGGIRVLRNRRNVGFLESSMTGAREARGEFLMFLNNDTEVREGWLDELLATFERDSAIGIAGSKLLFPNGSLQEVGGIIWRLATGWNWGRGCDPAEPKFCFMRDVDYVSGASLMISKSVFEEVGGFSPEFMPAYYEDTDLCFKVRATGRRVVVQPASQVVHHEGISSGTESAPFGMKRFQRVNQRVFLRKWFDTLQDHRLSGDDPKLASERLVRRRILFIDDTVPTPDRDAGSNAALEHMKSLQRLGYKVSFVGADNMAKISPYTEALEKIGIENYYAPWFFSAEDVLRKEARGFDLFYIHRMMNVVKYAPHIRQRFPGAKIVFNVADLHHLRLEREAAISGNKRLAKSARATKDTELSAIAAADSVIVHSTHERDLLRQIAPNAVVHVIPWVVRPAPVTTPFNKRRGVAFVGGYNHAPNVDAAEWLADEVMPLVHAHDPAIECLLIGSQMPNAVRNLERAGIRALGHVADIAAVLGSTRLTVAPLRFGAGLKGKVLTSLSLGLPCAATPCAVEGMGLTDPLTATTASSAREMAALIFQLHEDEAFNRDIAEAGVTFIQNRFSEQVVDGLMKLATTSPPGIIRGQGVATTVEVGQAT